MEANNTLAIFQGLKSDDFKIQKLSVFKGTKIRKTWHKEEWWFSVVDIVEALTDSNDPKQYIKKMRSRDPELNSNWGTICTPLQMKAKDMKERKINCANVEGAFRIIQSIPSPKAEPFKLWLAKVGKERFFNRLIYSMFRMFPSDPTGSLDAFYISARGCF